MAIAITNLFATFEVWKAMKPETKHTKIMTNKDLQNLRVVLFEDWVSDEIGTSFAVEVQTLRGEVLFSHKGGDWTNQLPIAISGTRREMLFSQLPQHIQDAMIG